MKKPALLVWSLLFGGCVATQEAQSEAIETWIHSGREFSLVAHAVETNGPCASVVGPNGLHEVFAPTPGLWSSQSLIVEQVDGGALFSMLGSAGPLNTSPQQLPVLFQAGNMSWAYPTRAAWNRLIDGGAVPQEVLSAGTRYRVRIKGGFYPGATANDADSVSNRTGDYILVFVVEDGGLADESS